MSLLIKDVSHSSHLRFLWKGALQSTHRRGLKFLIQIKECSANSFSLSHKLRFSLLALIKSIYTVKLVRKSECNKLAQWRAQMVYLPQVWPWQSLQQINDDQTKQASCFLHTKHNKQRHFAYGEISQIYWFIRFSAQICSRLLITYIGCNVDLFHQVWKLVQI